VIRYDDGPHAVLSSLSDLETYITQNSSPDIERRRYVRMSLRALEGRVVQWPYNHTQVSISVAFYLTWWLISDSLSGRIQVGARAGDIVL
jgi:hypothetical protein